MLYSFLSDFKVQHLKMFVTSKIRLAMDININCAVPKNSTMGITQKKKKYAQLYFITKIEI